MSPLSNTMASPDVIEHIDRFTYSPIPLDNALDRIAWQVSVEWAGSGRWAIRNSGYCLNRNGEWEHEPQPSSRTDQWLAEHRWEDLAEARRVAREVCLSVTWNGKTAADIAAVSGDQ
jgi:hypothetical protein